jgi:CRP-like cAMP-binding protein
MNLNYFLHIANVILLIGYSVRDILWLRLLAVASNLIAIPFFALQTTPLHTPIIWCALFAAINLFQSIRLVAERRVIQLTPEEERVRRLAFPDLPPRKVLELLGLGVWTAKRTGERLIESGKSLETISLVVQGKVRIARGERILGDLVPGNFVGSALLMSGVRSDVDAVAIEPVRALSWQVTTLESYLNINPETRIAVLKHLSRDLSEKIGLLSKS